MCVQVPPGDELTYVFDDASMPFTVNASLSVVGVEAGPAAVRFRVVVSRKPEGVAKVRLAAYGSSIPNRGSGAMVLVVTVPSGSDWTCVSVAERE